MNGRCLPLLISGSLFVSAAFGGSLDPGAGTIRVGVFGLFHSRQLTIHPREGRPFTLTCGEKRFRIEGSQSAQLTLAGQAVECRFGGLAALSTEVSILNPDAVFVLEIPGKIERHYRGALTVRPSAEELQPVISMPLETAVASIVAAEAPANADAGALEAQAVVTRSYLAAGPRHRNLNGGSDFDFCDTTHCQYLVEPPAPGEAVSQASSATRGMVLRHQGEVVRALYSARCGGATQTLEDVGLTPGKYPYYRVPCPSCIRTPDRWTRTIERQQASALIQQPDNETARLQIVRRLGWQALPSNNYQVSTTASDITFQGTGSGHGVGLCQQGAMGLASEGLNFQSILSHYFPNTSLASINP
ncbi:MAG: SpoIID/LytB domain-containing protein [Acidobacteria bacterium]|nr:SpoIID/LytB domain-containing protein [Acidobacteriota bacterium]